MIINQNCINLKYSTDDINWNHKAFIYLVSVFTLLVRKGCYWWVESKHYGDEDRI